MKGNSMGEKRPTRVSVLVWLYFISISLFWLWFIRWAAEYLFLPVPFPFQIPIWLLVIIIPLNIIYLFIYRNKVPFTDFLGLSLPFLFWILLNFMFPKQKTFSNALIEPGIIAAVALINLARSVLRKRFPQTKFTVSAWVLIFILVFVCYVAIPGLPE